MMDAFSNSTFIEGIQTMDYWITDTIQVAMVFFLMLMDGALDQRILSWLIWLVSVRPLWMSLVNMVIGYSSLLSVSRS